MAMPTHLGTADDTGLIEIRINCPNPWVADAIAARLLGDNLVAAVNRVEAFSSYRWRGVEKSRDEVILYAKTRANLFDTVVETVGPMHPFDEPSITAIDITYATENYREWVLSSTRAAIGAGATS